MRRRRMCQEWIDDMELRRIPFAIEMREEWLKDVKNGVPGAGEALDHWRAELEYLYAELGEVKARMEIENG